MNETSTTADPRIVRSVAPACLESPVTALDTFITPIDQHYVRNHYPVPEVDPSTWRLSVEGAVRTPLSLSLEQLQALPQTTRVVTLECAGNGRLSLTPAVPGVQWAQGAVSTAGWTGVLVADLLDAAGLHAEALEVVADGLDAGGVSTTPKPHGDLSYHRGLSVADARRLGALVAYRMNGEVLPPAHGFPARLVVPGAYGMAAVKWLRGLLVTTERFDGYWQTTDYACWDRSGAYPQQRPLLGMQVKALITTPAPDALVQAGTAVEVAGAAWSEGAITAVDVSTDGGATWQAATLLDGAAPGVWRRWRYGWQTPTGVGAASLMARATDSLGRVQPMTRNADYGTYVIDHVVPVPITLR